MSLPPVNPESPVAPQVAAAAVQRYDTPRLIDVPPVPRNIPTPAAIKLGVIGMVRCRGGVERFAVTHPPLSSGAVQFAENARDVAMVNPADVPPPDTNAKAEAEAAQLRAFAAPPAAIASGPAPTPDEGKPADLRSAPAAPPAKSARGRQAHAAAPAAGPAASAHPGAVAATAPSSAGSPAAASAPPPLPAPLADPMLARCS